MRSMACDIGTREAGLSFAIGLGRDVQHRAALFDLPTYGIGVVAFVAMQISQSAPDGFPRPQAIVWDA
jgi:hypothetical protein